jgi:hypothetical protein
MAQGTRHHASHPVTAVESILACLTQTRDRIFAVAFFVAEQSSVAVATNAFVCLDRSTPVTPGFVYQPTLELFAFP